MKVIQNVAMTSIIRTKLLWVLLLTHLPLLAMEKTDAPPAPPLILQSDQGEILLSDYRGKVILLDFWASWCGPCRLSFPWMNDLQTRYTDDQLVIIAVNLDKDGEASRGFLKEIPANFIIAYDPEGTSAETMKVIGMPMSYLIDRKGCVRQSLIGFNDIKKAIHEAHIRALLEEPLNSTNL